MYEISIRDDGRAELWECPWKKPKKLILCGHLDAVLKLKDAKQKEQMKSLAVVPPHILARAIYRNG